MQKLQTEFIIGKKTSKENYFYMLGCLPPIKMVSNGFLLGEPTDIIKGEFVYNMFFERNKKFYSAGLATIKDFNTMLIPE